MKNEKLLVANWKMNPSSFMESKKIFLEIKKNASKIKKTKIVVCPPYLYISSLKNLYSGKKISIGAQDCYRETGVGSHTGEISSTMLKNAGVDYVIIGHSERRAIWDDKNGEGMKESSDIASKKIKSALKENLIPILCIGEKERDENGEYLDVLRKEINQSLKLVNKEEIKKIILAYEPIWAIGKESDNAIKSEDLHTMSIFVKKVISEIHTPDIGKEMKVLYGGSVDSKNIKDLLKNSDIDGFLLGRASLSVDEFNAIIDKI